MIQTYVICHRNGTEEEREFRTYNEALLDASRLDCAVIRRTYTFDDSELVWTPDGSDTWGEGATA